MHQLIRCLGGLAALLVDGAAMAHTGDHAAGGFAAGLAHPFIGLDHLLAMVAVGIWAAQRGGRSVPALPALFVAAMAAGAAAGAYGVVLPQVESVLALSVLVLGLLVALALRAAWHAALPLLAVFALFHGHAHGAEMPALAQWWQYFAGFLVATAVLHAIGVCGALGLRERAGLLRCSGAAISFAGAWFLLA